MAYKFQLGNAAIAGVTRFKNGVDLNDQNITNIGAVQLDTISADNEEMVISLTDDKSAALEILEAGTSYMKFVTTNSQEHISMEVDMQLDDDKKFNFRDSDIHISSDADGYLNVQADTGVHLNIGGTDRALVTSTGLNVVGTLSQGGTAVALQTVNISAGTGLSGGGSLASTRTLSVAAAQTSITSVINSGFEAIGTAADQEFIDFTTSNEISLAINGSAMLTATATSVDIAGNLNVEGTMTVIESERLNVKDKMIELNVVTGSEARVSNSGAGLFISGSTVTHNASLILAADGGRFKASGSTAGFDVQTGGDYAINGSSVLNVNGAAKVQSAVAGDGLSHSNGVLAVGVDDSSIETSGDALRVKALGITNAMLGGSIADSKLNQITTAGKVALGALEIDGAADIGEALDDADLIIVDNGAGGTEVKCAMSRVKTYIENNATIGSAGKLKRQVNLNGPVINTNKVTISDDGHVDVFNITASVSAEISGSFDAGDTVTIKAGSSVSESVVLTVTSAAGYQYTYDGQPTLSLESSFAAVDLIFVSGTTGNEWMIL